MQSFIQQISVKTSTIWKYDPGLGNLAMNVPVHKKGMAGGWGHMIKSRQTTQRLLILCISSHQQWSILACLSKQLGLCIQPTEIRSKKYLQLRRYSVLTVLLALVPFSSILFLTVIFNLVQHRRPYLLPPSFQTT